MPALYAHSEFNQKLRALLEKILENAQKLKQNSRTFFIISTEKCSPIALVFC